MKCGFLFRPTPQGDNLIHHQRVVVVFLCMNMLRARLFEFELQKKDKENQNLENSKSDIGWGHQIRSYVLHPYRLVKDNRTNYESSDPEKILDGDIDDFLESSLYR